MKNVDCINIAAFAKWHLPCEDGGVMTVSDGAVIGCCLSVLVHGIVPQGMSGAQSQASRYRARKSSPTLRFVSPTSLIISHLT